MGITVKPISVADHLDVEISFSVSSHSERAELDKLKTFLASGATDRAQGKKALTLSSIQLDDVFDGLTLRLKEEDVHTTNVDKMDNINHSDGKFGVVIVSR